MADDSVDRLVKWYAKNCNEDWEHSYGVKIVTLDNPGWSVTIDLAETGITVPPGVIYQLDEGDDQWIFCKINERSQFVGACSPFALKATLDIFFGLVAGQPGNVE